MSHQRPDTMTKNEHSFYLLEQMPSGLRECVHEFSFPVVQAFLSAGIREPHKIRAIVDAVWRGARASSQGKDRAETIDWLVSQSGETISAKTLFRLLKSQGLVVVPISPTREMIEASMAEVSGFNTFCTKREKHQLRLKAALKAGEKYFENIENWRSNRETRLKAGGKAA